MGLEAIGTGIKTAIDGISGLQVYAPNELPDSLSPPAVVILPGEVSYSVTMGTVYEQTFRVIMLLTKADTPSAFDKMLPYLEPTGDSSIKANIESDMTLGGACESVRVLRNLGIGTTVWGGMTYLSSEFEVVAIEMETS